MELNFNNGEIEIWTKSAAKGEYVAVVKLTGVAKQLNEILKFYPKGTVFVYGDEILFKFDSDQIERIRVEVPIMGRILKQIVPPLSEDL